MFSLPSFTSTYGIHSRNWLKSALSRFHPFLFSSIYSVFFFPVVVLTLVLINVYFREQTVLSSVPLLKNNVYLGVIHAYFTERAISSCFTDAEV